MILSWIIDKIRKILSKLWKIAYLGLKKVFKPFKIVFTILVGKIKSKNKKRSLRKQIKDQKKEVQELKRKRDRIKTGRNVLNSVMVVIIMLVFVGIIFYQIGNLRDESSQLSAKEQKLQEDYEAESERTSELEEQRVYVQTKEYIEEAAKKLGFVYPDEIIFKPKQDK